MNHQLAGLINTSFLFDVEKEQFVARLRSGEDEENVANDFNTSLLAAFEQLKQSRDYAVKSFESATAILEAEHRAARGKISADTERALAKLRPTDFAARKQVWEDFDVVVETLEQGHQARLKQLLARALLE